MLIETVQQSQAKMIDFGKSQKKWLSMEFKPMLKAIK